jgi:hypothetical protein
VLRKRQLLVDRGRFEAMDPFHAAMIQAAHRALLREGLPLGREPQGLLEMALHPVIDDDAADDATVLQRIDGMRALFPALVTDIPEAYQLVPYLRRHTAEPIRLVGGVSLMARIFESQFYSVLPGSLLEGMGKLFATNVTFYVYPMPRDAVIKALGPATGHVRVPDSAGPLVTADDLLMAPPSNHLYRYLRETGRVVPIDPVAS